MICLNQSHSKKEPKTTKWHDGVTMDASNKQIPLQSDSDRLHELDTHTHTHTRHTHHTTHTHTHTHRPKTRGMPRDMQSHDVVIDTHHSEPLTAQRKSITSLCLTRHVSNAHRMALGRTLTHLHTHEHLN